LVFTSAKNDVNCDAVLEYVEHCLYGHELKRPMQLERETLFVPAGSDSINKVNVDFSTQSLSKDVNEPFEEVIKIPKQIQAKRQRNQKVVSVRVRKCFSFASNNNNNHHHH
jgi:hypothetical protein